MFGLMLFAFQDVAMKHFSDRYSMLQIVFLRGLIATIPLALAVLLVDGFRGFSAARPWLCMARGLMGFTSFVGYYMAIAALPLALVVAIIFSAPIMVTVISASFLGEQVGWRRWCAVLVGFCGVLVVTGPSLEINPVPAGYAMLGAVAYAGSTVLTRVIGDADNAWTMAFYSMVVFVLASAITSISIAAIGVDWVTAGPSLQFLARPWSHFQEIDLAIILALGVNAAIAFYCITKAYRAAPASLLAPFEYTYILWAVALGFLIWGEVPSATTAMGIVLLIGSGMFVLYREVVTSRLQRQTAVVKLAASNAAPLLPLRRSLDIA